MADTLKNNYAASTATGNSDVHDLVPANVDSTKTILSIILCNKDTDDAEFDIYLSGDPTGSDGDDNYRIYNQQSLPAGATFIHNSKLIIMPNEELKFGQRQSTAAATVDVTVSYLDQT